MRGSFSEQGCRVHHGSIPFPLPVVKIATVVHAWAAARLPENYQRLRHVCPLRLSDSVVESTEQAGQDRVGKRCPTVDRFVGGGGTWTSSMDRSRISRREHDPPAAAASSLAAVSLYCTLHVHLDKQCYLQSTCHDGTYSDLVLRDALLQKRSSARPRQRNETPLWSSTRRSTTLEWDGCLV